MPELPEAEIILRQLRHGILGTTIQSIWVGREDIIRKGLESLSWYEGASIQDIQRQGKTIVLTCVHGEESRYLLAELGMTGLLLFQGAPQKFETHTHMVLSLRGGKVSELRYWNARRFGRVHLLDSKGLEQLLGRRFGFDPLSVNESDFTSLVKCSRGRLKTFFLNQKKLAGIGNIYANEILYRAGVHPHARGNHLTKTTLNRLFTSMQEVLREAITWGGSTIRDFCAPDGTRGRFQEQHRVYQNTGNPCLRGCGTLIRRLSDERRSFFCPTCQKRK